MTPDEFRQVLRIKSASDIVETYLINDDPGPYVTRDALEYFEKRIRNTFQLKDEQFLSLIVVGSAKLGFSFLEKKDRNGTVYKPAYRSYEPGISDIDMAIVSPVLYGKIWSDLSRFGANQNFFPWKSDLGAYMFHGWIRPDKFPNEPLQRCSDWKGVFNEVSRSQYFRYKRLRCAIYHSKIFLECYQQRGVNLAQEAEQTL